MIVKFEISCFVLFLIVTVVLTPFCMENPAPNEPNCFEFSLFNSALKKPVMCAGQNAVDHYDQISYIWKILILGLNNIN